MVIVTTFSVAQVSTKLQNILSTNKVKYEPICSRVLNLNVKG